MNASHASSVSPDIPPRTPAPRRKFLHGRRPWGLADQVLISGTNFVTMIFAGRALGKAGFGEFTLVYNGLLLANMVQMALITQPHNVLGTGKKDSNYRSYTAGAALAQLAIAMLEAIGALAFVGIAYAHGWHCRGLLLALVPSIVAWQFQEFFRRVLYTEGRIAAAFFNDLVSYGGQASWIVALWWLDLAKPASAAPRLTPTVAMYVLAITSALAALLGAWQVRKSLVGRFHFRGWLDNWQFGRWLLGSEILTYCSSLPMYMYLVGAFISEEASGDLKAAQTLFGPARVISFYLATVLPIRFAGAIGRGGIGALDRQVKSTALRVLPILGIFCLLVALFAKPAMLIFGRDFKGNASVLAIYAIVAFLSYVQMVFAAALTARRLTHYIFMGSIAGAVVTLVLGVALTRAMGIDGALMGMILTGAAVTVVYGLAYRRGARAHATIASASKEQPLDESGIRTVGNEQGLEARGIIVTRASGPCPVH
ncbi:MAG TPA: polysaccharide biosynthesis C-terminal domain-containing protein [Tepidisphaeraceae bacterium]|nr:polysaccharide biosynthesis C-terminal domain-containing protein [Tepidisphaeraceae bacterium]